MGLTAALTGTQIGYLRRSRYAAAQYLSTCPNTVIFKARVDEDDFATSFAEVPFDTVTVGAIGDVVAGMTVWISATDDITAAHWRGRVRKASAATPLYINETSSGDIADNDYIFVCDDYAIHTRLAREVAGVQYKDYDISFERLPPVLSNVNAGYAGWVDGAGDFTVNFSAAGIAVADGAAISTWAWDFDDGNPAASAVAAPGDVDFPSGFRWVSVTITDSNAVDTVVHIPVWAHHPDDYPPETGFMGAALSASIEGGWNATVDAFDAIARDEILDRTLCCIWSDEYYGEPSSANDLTIIDPVEFVGRIRIERDRNASDETYSFISSTTFDIEGPMTQLARTGAQPITMRYDTTPTVWDEIDDMTPWREAVHQLARHSTFLELHSITVESVGDADDETYMEQITSARGTKLLDNVQSTLNGINARLEMDGRGRARVSRDARYLTTAQRAALTTVMDFELQDVIDFDVEYNPVPTVGRVEASGGGYITADDEVTPFLSWAPGEAQGEGEDNAQLDNQVLEANEGYGDTVQAELNTRSGHHFALLNNTARLRAIMPGGYRVFTPSMAQWLTWTLDASDTERGRVYTTADRWLIENMNVAHDNEIGGKSVEIVFTPETRGAPGQTVHYPDTGTIENPFQNVPPFSPFGGAFAETGDFWLAGSTDEDQPPYTESNPGDPAGPPPPVYNCGAWADFEFGGTSGYYIQAGHPSDREGYHLPGAGWVTEEDFDNNRFYLYIEIYCPGGFTFDNVALEYTNTHTSTINNGLYFANYNAAHVLTWEAAISFSPGRGFFTNSGAARTAYYMALEIRGMDYEIILHNTQRWLA